MEPLHVGIAGLGTVGAGVLKILTQYAPILAERVGRPIEVVAISARDQNKDRGIDTSRLRWVDDPLSLASDPGIDLVVETIGGEGGIARALVEASLKNSKSVVTANKALVAHHGVALAELAEKHDSMLAYEAAVAGGIPVIKTLRDGLAANRFSRVCGILNGTCNFILTKMWNEKRSFDDVLAEAQKLGYAEADPSFDVDGVDTAHKLAILTSLAFGCPPAIDEVYIEGIRRVSLTDMEFADQLGYTIKLLGIASLTEDGIEQRVHPCMVEKISSIGNVNDVYNAVQIEGDSVGKVFLEGAGAGAGPTASSVVADIMDIARGVRYQPFTLPVSSLKSMPFTSMEALLCRYYVRLSVLDQSGVLADITSVFKKEEISMRSFIQRGRNADGSVQVVLTTHATKESSMLHAMAAIAKLDSVKDDPYMIRIEKSITF